MTQASVDRRRIDAPPEVVYDILIDPHTYPDWVVGATRIRDVDVRWPAPGTCYHHSVGVGAATISDSTMMLEAERPSRLVMEVRCRPLAVAVVEFIIEPDGDATMLTFIERPTGGALGAVGVWTLPLLSLRNRMSLRRLETLAVEEARARRTRAKRARRTS